MDVVDSTNRSRMMAGIRSKNTKPEIALRRSMHRLGFRYRLHSDALIGRPDLVFPKHKAVTFVHGCFWHRHRDCRLASTPSTRPEFWAKKFSNNVERDFEVRRRLSDDGWRIAVIWECSLKKPAQLEVTAMRLADWLRSESHELEVGAENFQRLGT